MVGELRDRGRRLGLRLYFAQDGQQVVGGVGSFRLPVPHQSCAWLQEVDVFPGWRGQGYGDGLLTAVLAMLNAEGVSTVVVGADEDDWPLSWYRRRGFRDTVRVSLDR
jgi:predicted N-acetyltransferase YhbS